MTLTNLKAWLANPVPTAKARLVAIYVAGAVLLVASAMAGFLGPLLAATGWVAWLALVLLGLHVTVAFRSVRLKDASLLPWLSKLDATILAAGFLGKLYGIAKICEAIVNSTSPEAMAASRAAFGAGMSAALFSTMVGLAVSLWTHCATLVVANHVDQKRVPIPGPPGPMGPRGRGFDDAF